MNITDDENGCAHTSCPWRPPIEATTKQNTPNDGPEGQAAKRACLVPSPRAITAHGLGKVQPVLPSQVTIPAQNTVPMSR